MSTENDELTIGEIKRGAELFKLLLEWQQQSQEKDDNPEELDEGS